jgi:hypothetical protein
LMLCWDNKNRLENDPVLLPSFPKTQNPFRIDNAFI